MSHFGAFASQPNRTSRPRLDTTRKYEAIMHVRGSSSDIPCRFGLRFRRAVLSAAYASLSPTSTPSRKQPPANRAGEHPTRRNTRCDPCCGADLEQHMFAVCDQTMEAIWGRKCEPPVGSGFGVENVSLDLRTNSPLSHARRLKVNRRTSKKYDAKMCLAGFQCIFTITEPQMYRWISVHL